MAEISMICTRPSTRILDDLLGLAACRRGHSPADPAALPRLRANSWASLRALRLHHGSLAEARRCAEMRELTARVAGRGRDISGESA